MSENNRGAEKQTDFWNMLNSRNEHIILTILKQNFFYTWTAEVYLT